MLIPKLGTHMPEERKKTKVPRTIEQIADALPVTIHRNDSGSRARLLNRYEILGVLGRGAMGGSLRSGIFRVAIAMRLNEFRQT